VPILLYSTFYISFGIWIMKATIDQTPRELDETVRVDDAGTFAILRHLLVRLSASGMVTTV
jgi:multiple sugar transport system permease protein